jgi:uncharacterized protein with HEPN domain
VDDILDAIAQIRVADKRMRLGESLGDDVGVQMAYQAILYNLFVIAGAIRAIPNEILSRDPLTPWSEFVSLPDSIGPGYQATVPTVVHQTIQDKLGPLEIAVRRLRADVRAETPGS